MRNDCEVIERRISEVKADLAKANGSYRDTMLKIMLADTIVLLSVIELPEYVATKALFRVIAAKIGSANIAERVREFRERCGLK